MSLFLQQTIKFFSELSHFKTIMGVFLALFIISACSSSDGGGGAFVAESEGCDTGMTLVDGECVTAVVDPVCDTGQTLVGGACVPITCKITENLVGNECVTIVCTIPDQNLKNDGTCDYGEGSQKLSAGQYNTAEYQNLNTLSAIKAADGYYNIQKMINADRAANSADSSYVSPIKQGGEGQIVSVLAHKNNGINGGNIRYRGFRTSHGEFKEGGETVGFEAIYDTIIDDGDDDTNGIEGFYTGAAITSTGNCSSGSDCEGTEYAGIIAARKNDNGMHGVAFNAQVRGVLTSLADTPLIQAIKRGVGADVVALTANISRYDSYTEVEYETGKFYRNYSAGYSTGDGAGISATELAAWVAATDPAGDNKTIIVVGTGGNGNGWLNSENGYFLTRESGVSGQPGASPRQLLGNLKDANVPYFLASAPSTEDDLTSDRWLAVAGLAPNGAISSQSNGCGIAMSYCLAATGHNTYTTGGSGGYATGNLDTLHAASAVSGALALIKGAFPQITPEKLQELVLDSAEYIALNADLNGNDVTDDDENGEEISATEDEEELVATITRNGGDHKYNVVYGFGRLDLRTATTPSVVSSYVSASNNESVGALWQDTKLTLSSHFGSNFESVKFGIGDSYGRHFITAAPQTSYAPVAVSLDDYMGNLLGEDVQSQKLGGQAQANYSNTETQSWMNLEYVSGNATTKIAFQDSYKVTPLTDVGATTILRANNIRPASTNIGMMDVDYQLGNALSLSSYVARGEYDTGYKFDELGTDFDVNYKQSHLNIAIGNIREHDQFLGTNTSGAYALNAPTVSRFTDVTYGHDLGNAGKFNVYANYINYETDVDMLHDQFASIDGLQADQYQIGFTGKGLISKDDRLNVALITKLGVTDGALNQNSTLGYTADGNFNSASQSYDLAVGDRHQQFEITYQGRLYQNADKVSTFRDNRFFTSIRVDSNLNHVQGASQTEIIGGINARF